MPKKRQPSDSNVLTLWDQVQTSQARRHRRYRTIEVSAHERRQPLTPLLPDTLARERWLKIEALVMSIHISAERLGPRSTVHKINSRSAANLAILLDDLWGK